jgi:hypothetical protein
LTIAQYLSGSKHMIVMRMREKPRRDLVAKSRKESAQIFRLGRFSAINHDYAVVGCAYDIRIAMIIGHGWQLP